jgi:hypothetical protein
LAPFDQQFQIALIGKGWDRSGARRVDRCCQVLRYPDCRAQTSTWQEMPVTHVELACVIVD